MEIKTKFHQTIFLGSILLIILLALSFWYSFSYPQYIAYIVVFLIIYTLTFKRQLYRIIKIQENLMLEFRILGFIKKKKVYRYEDLKFEVKHEVTYRGGDQEKLVILDKNTNTIILEVGLRYLEGDIGFLIE